MLYSALFIFNIPNMPAASGNCGKGGRVSKMEIPPFPQDNKFPTSSTTLCILKCGFVYHVTVC